LEKTQKAFAFHFIEKRDSLLQASKGQAKQAKIQIQWTSQACGRKRPGAPALAHSVASSLIYSMTLLTEG
jgi:hypothetical protein